MATAEPMLPPELAVDEPPVSDTALEAFTKWAVEVAAESAVDVGELVDDVALGDTGLDNTAPVPRWTITDDGAAEWAMRHLAQVHVQLAELGEQAEAWQRRITEWFQQRAHPLVARGRFFEAHLERYGLEVRERTNGKQKSVTLPSGRIATTASSARPVVLDDATVVAWARETLEPEAVADVVKVPDPTVRVSDLRANTTIHEVIDLARVAMSGCGCVVYAGTDPDRAPSGQPWVPLDYFAPPSVPHPGVACPACRTHAEAWQVEVVYSHLEVWGPDGKQVPGTDVAPGNVTAKANPA